jgi:hypothetical protein
MIYQPINPNHPAQAEWYESYFTITPESCQNAGYAAECKFETDVYVICFNNLFLAEYQIATLCRFFASPVNIIMVDNNNWLHPDVSEALRQLCEREGVTYLKAPDNYYQIQGHFDPSMKLGTTMNWLYVQCARKRNPKYFGFLDHDCFLIHEFDIRPHLDRLGMYGEVVESKKDSAWGLHVPALFFRRDFVGDRLMDFRASYPHELDTGGANYDVLYKDYDRESYRLSLVTPRFDREDVNRKDSVQHYALLDHVWFHICATSHDQLVGDGKYKLAYSKGYLDSRLQHG